jgi:gliding motility-associated-like protein
MKKYFLFLVCFFSLLSFDAFSSHIAGANITYVSLGPNTYRVRVTLFRDCSGINLGTSISGGEGIRWRNNCGQTGGPFTANLIAGSGVEIPTPCSDQITTCTDRNNGVYGVEKYEYEAVITLPAVAANCQTFYFSWSTCCRNTSNTIAGGLGASIYVEAMVNNSPGILNSSVAFRTFQVPSFCILEPVNVLLDGDDVNGDSLVFSLTPARQSATANVNYAGGYSPTQFALSAGAPPVVNQASGNVSFISAQAQNVVMALTVEEYRAGVLVGISSIDIQMVLGTGRFCNNITPSYLLDTVPRNCTGNLFLNVRLNTAVECNTVTQDGSELRLYDFNNVLVPINSVSPDTCTNGRTRGLNIVLGKSLEQNGIYYLVSRKGNDGDTYGNQCNRFMAEFDTSIYIVTGCPEYVDPFSVVNVSVDSTNTNAAYAQWVVPSNYNYNWFGSYKIYRRDNVAQSNFIGIGNILDSTQRSYVDYYSPVFPKDGNLFYAVNSQLKNLFENPLSNELGTIRLVNDPVDVGDNFTLSLKWTQYQGWSNPVYHIQYKDLQRELIAEWNPTEDNNITTDTSITFTKPTLPGLYLARVYTRDSTGSFVSYSNWTEFEVRARDIKVPNVVTPNGDGVNDAFVIENLDFYINGKLKVFNRWGQLVYESSDYKNDWIPSALENGTYYFQLAILMDVDKTTEYKGALQVIK